MLSLYKAAKAGDLERVMELVDQKVDKNQVGGEYGMTILSVATKHNHIAVVQYLVEQGADMEKGSTRGAGFTPLHYASEQGNYEVARYLLEQGANRDKVVINGMTPLHLAALTGQVEIAKLLMVYGADLNARNSSGNLPINVATNEEIKQAIRDEPRRRMDEAPGKRATASASVQEDEDEEKEHINKKPRVDEEGKAEDGGKVADEEEDSEPSDGEDD